MTRQPAWRVVPNPGFIKVYIGRVVSVPTRPEPRVSDTNQPRQNSCSLIEPGLGENLGSILRILLKENYLSLKRLPIYHTFVRHFVQHLIYKVFRHPIYL